MLKTQLRNPPVEQPLTEVVQTAIFPPSAELGEQLGRLEEAQVEIDRKKAEELARLREIQSRD